MLDSIAQFSQDDKALLGSRWSCLVNRPMSGWHSVDVPLPGTVTGRDLAPITVGCILDLPLGWGPGQGGNRHNRMVCDTGVPPSYGKGKNSTGRLAAVDIE
jgi:hypothetical protein